MKIAVKDSETQAFEVPETILTRFNSPESVTIMNLEDYGDFFEITGPAAQAWVQLTNKKTLRKIVKYLGKEYGVPESLVEEKMDKFVKTLTKHGLLKRSKN